MKNVLLLIVLPLVFLSEIPKAWAYSPQQFGLLIGTNQSFGDMALNLTGFFMAASSFVCGTIFMIGTFFVVISGGGEKKDAGKKMMIGALIGLAVILGAYAIMRTIFFVLYLG